jgi:hypothetical protein
LYSSYTILCSILAFQPPAHPQCASRPSPSEHTRQSSSAEVQLSSSNSMSRRFSTLAVLSDQVGRITDVFDSQQDVLERDRLILLGPAERSREAFVLCKEGIISACWVRSDKTTQTVLHIPKKYSTSARSAVPASESPNAMIGAASSPRLNCSIVEVNV